MSRSSSPKIWSGLIYLYIAWGSTYLAIHYLVETIPPLLASGMRNASAGVIMLIYAKITEPKVWPDKRSWLVSFWAGILMLGVGNGGVSIAVAWVPTGYAALIVAAVPIWLVLLQWIWLRIIPTKLVLLGVFAGIVGVSLLLNFDAFSLEGSSAQFTFGILALLAATFCWSWGMVVSQQSQVPYSAAYISAMQMIGGGMATLFVSGIIGEWNGFTANRITPQAINAFIYLLTIGSLGGFTVFSWLSQHTSPTLLATYNYVNPLVALLLGYLFVGEQLSFKVVLAAVIIIAAVLLITAGQRQPKSTELSEV
ncbi:MAG: EamA family transporter [Siphonobacter sp.]